MNRIYSIILLLCVTGSLHGQDIRITTFILVRHAEKANDGTRDPALSPEGAERSGKLAALFAETIVGAVYSTNYKRTRNTVTPIAEAKAIEIRSYEATSMAAIDEMLDDHVGETIIVAGHSNTIPAIANHLLGRKEFSDYDESDYGNILIVTVVGNPRTAAVIRLRY